MKYGIYSVKDAKVGFSIPFTDNNDQTAIRGFTFALNNPEQQMNSFPNDYFLFKIGEFDDEKGKIVPRTPELLCSGIDVYGANKK